jgi:hypothetical protein
MRRRNIAIFAIVVLAVFLSVFFYLYVFQPSIMSVPLDAGWLGFLFIFANGFFFSYILMPKVNVTERLLLTVGLGFGLTFVFMILLGVLWEISFLTVALTNAVLLAALAFAAVHRGLRIKSTVFPKPNKTGIKITKHNLMPALLLVLIGVFALVALYDTVAFPATEWDSLTYGVNYAKIIFNDGKIPLIAGPSIGLEMSASYPPGVQLAAVSSYVLAGTANDFYFRLIPPIFSIATLIITYAFAMEVNKSRKISVYAVFGLSLIPFFWELYVEESYLMALTFLLTAAAYFFFKAYNSSGSDAKKYEVAGALFCGFASLTSYIGLFAFGIVLLYSAVKKINLKHFTWLIALPLLVALPWYVRNFVLLGNPLYPFLGIGQYLDPLLRSSTSQHFLNYSLLPFYGALSAVSKVVAVVLGVAIVYFAFFKRKNLLLALPLYLLFAGFAVMGFHVAFPRYLLIALPVLVVVCSQIILAIPKKYDSPRVVAAILLALIVFSSALMLPYINSVKPPAKSGETQSLYLSRIYEEGDAWQWINQNTPLNATIATFDIKQYYLDRNVFSLDGNESTSLYRLQTINESMNFLEENGVSYVLSVPWASPTDNRLPPAYNLTILTRYLGDPQYLPPLFVGANGTTVYHVGAIDEKTLYQTFQQNGMVPPLKHLTVNLTLTNTTSTYLGKCYLPIPVDYKGGLIVASINSSTPLQIQLWSELIPNDKIEKPSEQEFMYVAQSPVNASAPYSLTWSIDRAGYFTFRVLGNETAAPAPFNVTLDLKFYNWWDSSSVMK